MPSIKCSSLLAILTLFLGINLLHMHDEKKKKITDKIQTRLKKNENLAKLMPYQKFYQENSLVRYQKFNIPGRTQILNTGSL